MPDDRFDLIVVDEGARTFPAVPGTVKAAAGWVAFLPAIGEVRARSPITLPAHRVYEILHNRPMPPADDPDDPRQGSEKSLTDPPA